MEVTGPMIENAPYHKAAPAAANLPNFAAGGMDLCFSIQRKFGDFVALRKAGLDACPT
jgi:hypothetical protein